MESFVGTILPVAFNYAPNGWLPCDGRLLPISQYQALFALITTTYGGDGVTTFALPDLRGRAPLGQGTGPGLTPMQMGQKGGTNNVTAVLNGSASVALTAANLPAHNHSATFAPTGGGGPIEVKVNVSTSGGTNATPNAGDYIGAPVPAAGAAPKLYRSDAGTSTVELNSLTATATGGVSGGTVTVGNTGSGTPLAAPVTVSGTFSTMPPYLGLNFIICVDGIFPSRP